MKTLCRRLRGPRRKIRRAIKPGTLLSSTENSKIVTACKTVGETPQTALSIVVRNLRVFPLLKGARNSKAPASALQPKWFSHHRQNSFSFVSWAQIKGP